ncbi:MAG TPA: Uma2 family endonuclease, partial [Aggregatilineales bacterium]|nr:Uma2 family endonuclease [Aggregatilineales bacterium]
MLDVAKQVTIDEFWAFVNLPENEDRRWELINGEIVEMAPSSKINSLIALLVATYLTPHIMKHKLGYVTGVDGGYRVGRSVLEPDFGYISKARSGGLKGNFYENAPDLAVEVVSVKSEKDEDAFRKAYRYLSNGTRMVWVVYPDDKTVYVCIPDSDGGMKVNVFDTTMTLSGGDVLPNFSL